MVIDTSALLALLFREEKMSWVRDRLKAHQDHLIMSIVSLTECLIILQERRPSAYIQVRNEILSSQISFVPPTLAQAESAALARRRYPLNLGDCFVYALAMETGDPILTLDHDFKKTDATVMMPD